MRVAATLGAVLVLAAGLAAAPPAGGARDDASDVAAAREFSYAAYRLRVAVKAEALKLASHHAELTSPRCSRAADRAPKRVRKEAFRTYGAAVLLSIVDDVRPAVGTFAAELDRVAVSDRALRRGRAEWRETARVFAAFPPFPRDACAQFERWRKAGYTRATKPAIAVKAFEKVSGDEKEDAAATRRLRAAARRMRALGVSRGAAERFTGEKLLEGIPGLGD